jgi:hypothetical protein
MFVSQQPVLTSEFTDLTIMKKPHPNPSPLMDKGVMIG